MAKWQWHVGVHSSIYKKKKTRRERDMRESKRGLQGRERRGGSVIN